MDDNLLEAIPAEQLTREQIARWRCRHTTPTYKLRREPKTLYDLESYYGPKIAIWMDNRTLVQVSQNNDFPAYQHIKKHLRLTYCMDYPRRRTIIVISGKTDEAIADTATFWWNLHCPEESNPSMEIDNYSKSFDFRVMKTEHSRCNFCE